MASTDTPPISFTEDGLTQEQRRLVGDIVGLWSVTRERIDALEALLAAYDALRRERVPRVSDMQVKRCVEGLREFSAKLEGGPAAVTFDSAELLERQSRRIAEQDVIIARYKAGDPAVGILSEMNLVNRQVERIAELEKDAARYRWLRENDATDTYSTHISHMLNDLRHGYESASLDNAIDAALATAQPSEG